MVEALLAGATFSLIITGLVGAFIYGQEASATAGLRGRAALVAEETLEAVRNIADAGFANLVDGNHGLSTAGGQWSFSGTGDSVDGFTRVITVSTIDADRKLVTTTLTWQQTPSRTGSVQLSSRYTNWHTSTPTHGTGLLVYADQAGPNGPDTVRYRTLDALDWTPVTGGAGSLVPDFTAVANSQTRRVELYAKPGSNEKVLITKHVKPNPGPQTDLWAQVWDGSSWGNVVNLATWGNAGGILDGRDFDASYLGNGNLLVVYENDTATPHYRTWNGTSWSADASTGVTLLTGASNPEWVTVRARPGTNEAMVAVLDSGRDTNTFYFDGAAFPATSLLEHALAAPGQQYDGVGFGWSASSPTLGVLLYNDANDATVGAKRYDTSLGTCTLTPAVCFSAAVTQAVGGNTRAVELVPRTTAAEWLACIKNAGNDINCYEVSSTPAFTSLTNGTLTLGSDAGNERSFASAIEVATDALGLTVYSSNAATPRFRTFDPATNSYSAEFSLTALAASVETARAVADPGSDDILLLVASTGQSFSSVGWSGDADALFVDSGLDQQVQGTSVGSNDLDFWFDFEWDQAP